MHLWIMLWGALRLPSVFTQAFMFIQRRCIACWLRLSLCPVDAYLGGRSYLMGDCLVWQGGRVAELKAQKYIYVPSNQDPSPVSYYDLKYYTWKSTFGSYHIYGPPSHSMLHLQNGPIKFIKEHYKLSEILM